MVAVESTENELPGGTQVLGRYSVLGKLAQGGMAEVYLARQIGPAGYNKLVVVKRVRPHLASDEDFVGMFVNEARLAAMINHPNVVQIFDLGDQPRPSSQGGGQDWFLAMEYLDGRDMLQVGRACRAHNKAVPFDVTARIIADACAGLDHAHGLKGADGKPLDLVHRDMSPENVLITFEGQVKVVDFGIAKASDNLIKTQAGQIKGKLGYVAPEAILGKPVDARADVFAIGATLYLFLSGRPAFTGSNPMEIFERSLKPPVPPREVNSRVPEQLDAICMKALAQDREKRYRSAGEVRAALEAYLTSTGRPLGPAQLSQFMRILFPPDKDPVRQRIDKLLADAPAVEVKRAPTLPPQMGVGAPAPVPVTMPSSPVPVAPHAQHSSEPEPIYYDDDKTNIVVNALPHESPDPVTMQGSRPAHLRSVGVADVGPGQATPPGARPVPLPRAPSATSLPASMPPATKQTPAMADMTFDDLEVRTVPGVRSADTPNTVPVKQPPQAALKTTPQTKAPVASIEIDDDLGDIDIAGALADADEADALATLNNIAAPVAAAGSGKTAVSKAPTSRASSVDAIAAALDNGFSVDDDMGPPPPLDSSMPTRRPPRTEVDEAPTMTTPQPPAAAQAAKASLPPLPSAPLAPVPPSSWGPAPSPPSMAPQATAPEWSPPPEPPYAPPPPTVPPTFIERAPADPAFIAPVPAAGPSLGLRLAMLGFGAVSGLVIVVVVLAASGQLSRIMQ